MSIFEARESPDGNIKHIAATIETVFGGVQAWSGGC